LKSKLNILGRKTIVDYDVKVEHFGLLKNIIIKTFEDVLINETIWNEKTKNAWNYFLSFLIEIISNDNINDIQFNMSSEDKILIRDSWLKILFIRKEPVEFIFQNINEGNDNNINELFNKFDKNSLIKKFSKILTLLIRSIQ
jgi:hypothetical protein